MGSRTYKTQLGFSTPIRSPVLRFKPFNHLRQMWQDLCKTSIPSQPLPTLTTYDTPANTYSSFQSSLQTYNNTTAIFQLLKNFYISLTLNSLAIASLIFLFNIIISANLMWTPTLSLFLTSRKIYNMLLKRHYLITELEKYFFLDGCRDSISLLNTWR